MHTDQADKLKPENFDASNNNGDNYSKGATCAMCRMQQWQQHCQWRDRLVVITCGLAVYPGSKSSVDGGGHSNSAAAAIDHADVRRPVIVRDAAVCVPYAAIDTGCLCGVVLQLIAASNSSLSDSRQASPPLCLVAAHRPGTRWVAERD